VFVPGKVRVVYAHHDRVVLGGVPAGADLPLPTFDELPADFFLQNREFGVGNVGGLGTAATDGTTTTC
jgi:4-deoxy-L-threo-5-hexosulose-uronate ketol-isomerase